MGLTKFKSQTVFLDTAPLIYFIEGNSQYQEKLRKLFTAIDNGEFTFITSTLTLLEVLVQPIKMGRQDLVQQYKHILTTASGIKIIEMDIAVASQAAGLRAKYNLKTPDSIQIGTAIEYGARYFLTNDIRLYNVKEIEVITMLDV